MRHIGYEIGEDGITEWRNNGGCIERRAMHSGNNEWENVAEPAPHTDDELRAMCENGGFGYRRAIIHTIPQKMSNSGSIHDIASGQRDREIKFAPGCKYAVILASYYGGKGYTTHRTASAAVAKSRSVRDFSHKIIDCDGVEHIVDFNGSLVAA